MYSVCFSPDSFKLASGSEDKTTGIWEADSGVLHCTLTISYHLFGLYPFLLTDPSL
jgi:WD40 repeat protein